MNPIRVACAALLSGFTAFATGTSPRPAHAEDSFYSTQILVDLRDDTDEDDERAIEAKLGGLDLRLNSVHAEDERFFVAEVDPADLSRLIREIERDPRVEHAEENAIYFATMVPDDPLFTKQWSFEMVRAGDAWEHASGKGVTVAVIDTGVAYEDHEKFKRVEDLDGTAFAGGYDFVSDDEHPNDDHGHGTHVAGTIAQTTNNGRGVAGLAHGARIMPIKVLDRFGRGTAADISDAIRYAADEGANVINMSLGGGLPSFVMKAAVAYARKKGVVVVCAAGNTGRGVVEFPAAYPGAFAVSSVGPEGRLAFYSSWGKEIAVAAPGGDKSQRGEDGGIIQNTITPDEPARGDRYLAFQGTSMAAPHVAAAAALVMSAGVTDAGEVEKILRETARPGASADENRYGAGIIDAGRAAETAKSRAGGSLWYLVPALAGLFVARRRRMGFGAIAGAVMGASGLFFLSGLGAGSLPFGAFLTHPVASWDLAAFGAGAYRTPLWASAVPFIALVIATIGAKRWSGWSGFFAGLGIGWAAHLAVAAILMPADVAWIPGLAGVLDRIWLAANALLIGAISLLIARR